MHLVVEFMNETIREAEEAKRRADDAFLAKKMAEIEISPRIAKLLSFNVIAKYFATFLDEYFAFYATFLDEYLAFYATFLDE